MANKINIPAISYTNKDFRSIYPEMLDLAKQLTNRWDPSKSNESDPGVVLLKEAAFVADHNNYNIDKNILENFLPSATQDISVRNITEMNGYTPRYYISANGEVSIKWKMPEEDTQTVYTIPAFTLVLSDAEDTVSYTQISDIVISNESIATGLFIEGTLQTLNVNDTSVIHLSNLDDNNRLYLPESMVAQNGIFIKNTNSDDYNDYWERDNYLLTRPVGSRVYKIDYDSNKDLPYIEFPSDISNIIGDGIEIRYISTSGEAGNISANTLSKIVSPSQFIPSAGGDPKLTENFTVWNPKSITNGKNPETIDEMYQSFRRVVGTFDTLVTCNDYSNKIYELADSYDNPYVSNVYVTDRRSDFNKSTNVVSYDTKTGDIYFKNISIKPCSLLFRGAVASVSEIPDGAPGDMWYVINEQSLYINISTSTAAARWVKLDQNMKINLNDFSILTSAMTPYDLVIYALKVFSLSDYIYSDPSYAYNKSFTPISNTTLRQIKAEIEETKCLSHDYNDPENNDVFCFKNYAPLEVRIYLYNKIKPNSKQEVLNAIYRSLSENFNPRHLRFGEELDVDAIKNVIIESDSRIKDADVSVSYNLWAMYTDGTEQPLITDSNTALMVELVAKNVLAGRVCLFNFDDDFKFDFGQIDGVMKSGTQITTEVPISLNNGTTKTQYYTAEVKRKSTTMTSSGSDYQYLFKAPNFTQSSLVKGSSYVLTGDDTFTLYPVDSSTGKVLKDQAVEYKSYDTFTYTITNSLSAALVNTSSGSSLRALPSGEIMFVEDDTTLSQEEGVLNLDYTLNENEAIQIMHPNYYSEKTFSTYVNYRYLGTTSDRIYANTEHTLKASEKIILLYTTESGNADHQEILYPGQIVKTSFNLIPTDELKATGVKKNWTDDRTGTLYANANFRQLTSNQTISVRQPMNTILNSSGIWCYWIINSEADGVNRLFTPGVKTRILRNDEYFIYTNSSLNEMMILGSGTMLTRTDSDDSLWKIDSMNIEDISALMSSGTNVEIPWQKNINFISSPFTITEMNVITLGEGDRITIFDWTNMSEKDIIVENEVNVINNKLQSCNGSIRYVIDGTETTLPSVDNFYQIRSRLDLNMSRDNPQRLYYKDESAFGYGDMDQRVTIGGSTLSSKNGDLYVQSSEELVLLGDTANLAHSVNLYAYKLDGKTYSRSLTVEDKAGTFSYPFFYKSSVGEKYIIPIHINGNATPINVRISEGTLEDYNNPNIEAAETLTLDGNSSYYLCPTATTTSEGKVLTMTISWPAGQYFENEIISIEDIIVINGMNPELKIGRATMKDVLDKMNSIISGSDSSSTKYYYPYRLDNSVALDNTDFEDANTVWDVNNIANHLTIAQIDFANSNFVIPKSMIDDDKGSILTKEE